MFLKITNKGLAPIESFTVLGLSTARGNADKIGQFGSGAKHGILTCLRNKITPQVYIGTELLEFATEAGEMAGKRYDRVMYSWRGNVERSSMVLDFGSLDWTKLEMGLREFVSNALDSVNGDATQVGVYLVNNVIPNPDETTIVIPVTPSVEQFAQTLADTFLHWHSSYSAAQKILPKAKPSKCRYYRKGVFVRESPVNSLFDYNLGEDSKIDESRNLSDYAIIENCAKCWQDATLDELFTLFSSFDSITDTSVEGTFYSYNLMPKDPKQKQTWKNAFAAKFGESAVGTKEQATAINAARKKGLTVTIVPNCWAQALIACGVEGVPQLLEKAGYDGNGRMTKPASAKLVALVMKIWGKLEEKGLTQSKPLPAIKMFTNVMNAGEVCGGYYDEKTQTIFIEENFKADKKVILEELAHYITGSTDNSRDFQDYAFKVAATFLR